MVSSLFASLGVNASADDSIVIYEVKQGDTLYSVCKGLGYNCERFNDIIMCLNSFSDAKQLTGLRVGQKIAVPSSGVAAEGYLNAWKADPKSVKAVMIAGVEALDRVITVTVEKGDTLYSLCSGLGFGHITYKELLMKLNGFTDEAKLTNLKAGQTLVLPVSLEAADELCDALGIKTAKDKNSKEEKKLLVAGNMEKVAVGDIALYYLTEYKMQKNDNIKNLLTSWEVKFEDYSELILSLNGLKDFNHISTSKVILLPTNLIFEDGTYYTVVSHKVQSGDTADSICKSFGLEYNKALDTLKKLNPSVAFPNISAGAMLNIPVAGVVPLGEIKGAVKAPWKAAFEAELYSLYGATVDHYEDLGGGYYQAFVVHEGKIVPYVTINSATGEYHG